MYSGWNPAGMADPDRSLRRRLVSAVGLRAVPVCAIHRRGVSHGSDAVKWWLDVTADIMIVALFIRVCVGDFKEYVFRKIRKKIGLG